MCVHPTTEYCTVTLQYCTVTYCCAAPDSQTRQTSAPSRLGSHNGCTRITRGLPKSVFFNHTQYILLIMSLSISTSSRDQSTGRIGQGAISSESQPQRCASFSCCAFWLASKHGPWATDHVLHPSTSSMMTPFSMYSISIAHFF